MGSGGSLAIQKPSTSNSAGGLTICQPCDAPSSKSVDKSSEQTSESSATMHASRSSQDVESGRPAPLGLGLGGLQPTKVIETFILLFSNGEIFDNTLPFYACWL